MALQKVIIDARIEVSGKKSILGLDNPLNLNNHIKNVVKDETTNIILDGTYDFQGTLKTDGFDESTTDAGVTIEGVKLENGGVTTGTLFAGFMHAAAQTNIAAGAGGAIPVTAYYTTINTDAGGDAFTLANGLFPGHLKRIRLIVDGGGDGVVTPVSLSGGTTITFNDANDEVILMWNETAWVCIFNSGTTIA